MSLDTEMFTIGVEEEYQIIDPMTGELSPDAEAILHEAQKTLGEEVQLEFHLSQIEVATPICRTLADVRAELIHLRHAVIAAAASRSKQIAASGSHPFSHWSRERITPYTRYREMEDEYQQLAREQCIFGCHVHVGVQEREVAIQVMNHMRPWLPFLLAISGNSPFWWGTDTGYTSFRTVVWSRWPLSGPMPAFASFADYQSLVASLVASGSIKEPTRIYWDMRLAERFGTIEVRVMDVFLTIDDAVMVTGLIHALVRTCYEEVLQEKPFPPVPQELLRTANWHAARYGLEGYLIDPFTESLLGAEQIVQRLLLFLRPALEASGDWEEVTAHVHRTVREGTGAVRQRALYQRTGQMHDLVNFIVAETAKGTTAMV